MLLEMKPDNWDRMPIDSSGREVRVHLVTLPTKNSEYKKVLSNFHKTMTCQASQLQSALAIAQSRAVYNKIISIERIQNTTLYSQYITYLNTKSSGPSSKVSDYLLWHGTSPDTIDKINNQGFNRSFAGKNGNSKMPSMCNYWYIFNFLATVYGRGVYFARDASYSDRYATPDPQGVRRMYLANVLTGEYTKGISRCLCLLRKTLQ